MQTYGKLKHLSWKNKMNLMKSIIYELIKICIGSCIFFFFTFIIVWIITLIISPSPYQYEIKPNFFLQPLDTNTLSTLIVNENIKQQICISDELKLNQKFRYQQVNLQQFCNLNYDKILYLGKDFNIFSTDMDFPKIKYITGCIKFRNEKLHCQKYPISQNILIFKNIDLTEVVYLKIKIELKGEQWPSKQLTLLFQQTCNYLIRFVKDHYNIFSLILSYGMTICFTLGAIIFRIQYLYRSYQDNILKCD